MVEGAVEEAEHRGSEEDSHHGVVHPSGRRIARGRAGKNVKVMRREEVNEAQGGLKMTVNIHCKILAAGRIVWVEG